MKKLNYSFLLFMLCALNSFGQNYTFIIPTPLGSPGIGYQSIEGCKSTGIVMDDASSTTTQDASAIWCNSHRINLTQSFQTRFNMRFGNVGPGGADGITFTLQREGFGAIESGGGYLGVSSNWLTGIAPSVNVEFDIFDNDTNGGDIDENHTAISYNGNLQNPIVPASAINLTNDAWHAVRINWDACLHQLTVRLDEVVVATLNADLTADVFGNDPENVIFGFTSASQSGNTNHDICFVDHTSAPCVCEDVPNPTLSLSTPVNCNAPIASCCIVADVQTNAGVQGSILYDWGDGQTTTSNEHTYATSGTYFVTAYVQYHLLSSPSTCCTKEAQMEVEINCLEFEGEFSGKAIESLTNDSKPTVFPNPIEAGDVLTIEHPSILLESTLSIFNINGKEILNFKNENTSSAIKIQIPLDMENGIYFLKDSKGQFKPIKFSVSN